MGAAKRRGTFEERRAQSIARHQAETEARREKRRREREAEEARVVAMTDEEREAYYTVPSKRLTAFLLIGAAMAASAM